MKRRRDRSVRGKGGKARADLQKERQRDLAADPLGAQGGEASGPEGGTLSAGDGQNVVLQFENPDGITVQNTSVTVNVVEEKKEDSDESAEN